MTFTSLGAKGREGPRDTLGYQGTPLEGKIQINNGGTQIWSVPKTGVYSVTAWGASGGNATNKNGDVSGTRGGRGAKIRGHFQLNAGEKLKILVGQQGGIGDSYSVKPGGGGGGTFVTKEDDTPLVIAGGGGGGTKLDAFGTLLDGDPGQATENGTRHGGYNGLGGRPCPFASDFIAGSGGGGYRGSGESSSSCDGGQSFLNGGRGGTCWSKFQNGGFGGGGGAESYPGGGGGYSGGGIEAGEAPAHSKTVAGGGGSYNAGTNQQNTEGVRQGDGEVIIKLIQ